jgi:capsular polysaccharide biosynthesis protein
MLTIFFLIGVWIVYKASTRVIAQYKHLSDEEVRDVMTNKMDKFGNQYSRIIRHLGLCEDCQNRLHHYDRHENLEDHLIDED